MQEGGKQGDNKTQRGKNLQYEKKKSYNMKVTFTDMKLELSVMLSIPCPLAGPYMYPATYADKTKRFFFQNNYIFTDHCNFM